MGADDASPAEMRRSPAKPDPDPLALDDATVERLLRGELSPDQAPPGYAEVVELLAAATAPPSSAELAGQAAALAELRAVTRPRRAAIGARRAARPRRRRRTGLAIVVVAGALVTGGVAGAATGHLPGPLRDVARSITGAGAMDGAEPATPTQPDPPASSPASAGVTAGPKGPLPTGSTAPGPGPKRTGPVVVPGKERLCKAYLASRDREQGNQMDTAAFERLVEAAGGESRIPAYCNGAQPGDPKSKDEKQQPPGGQEQGQGGASSPSNGGGQGQDQPPSTQSSNR
jgi:hypothetical protein